MTPLDWVIVGTLLFSVASAFFNGFLVELCSLAGLVTGITLAGLYYAQLTPWLRGWITTPALRNTVAVLLIAVGVMVVAGILGRLLRWATRRIGLGGLDRLAGAVFGVVKGSLLVTIGIMALLAFFPEQPWLLESRLAPYFVGLARDGAVWMPDNFGNRVLRGAHIPGKMEQPSP